MCANNMIIKHGDVIVIKIEIKYAYYDRCDMIIIK